MQLLVTKKENKVATRKVNWQFVISANDISTSLLNAHIQWVFSKERHLSLEQGPLRILQHRQTVSIAIIFHFSLFDI